jgi:hypothetical protein
MKASDKPELSKKWWSSEKPSGIKGTDLEKALQAVEKALSDDEKASDEKTIDSCLISFQELEKAVDKTIKKELDKKKHKDEITVLEKYYAVIKSESRRLEDAKAELEEGEEGEEGDEEDEEDEGKLFEKDYLYKMIKMMKSTGKELNFGFGMDSKAPESSVLLLSRKGKPDKLFRALKQTGNFSNRLITYGRALPDPENGKVLVFRLDDGAGEPPQIIKLGRVFLRKDKSLRFRKLKLVLPGGQTLIDEEPDIEDGEVAGGGAGGASAALQGLLRSAATAADVWKRSRESADEEIAQLRRELAAFDEPGISSIRERLATLLNGYPDLDLATLASSGDQAAFDRSLEKTRTGIVQWRRMLAGDPALRTIDENPFVKTNVVRRFDDALGVISNQLKL